MTGPPEGVHNCSVRNQSLNQLLFTCQPGDNGGLRQIFFLEVYHDQESSQASPSALTNLIFTQDSPSTRIYANLSSVDVPEFFVQNLPHGTKFTFNVYAVNSKGRSPAVSYTTSTLSPPEKQTKTYGESNFLHSISFYCMLRDQRQSNTFFNERNPFIFQGRLFVQVELFSLSIRFSKVTLAFLHLLEHMPFLEGSSCLKWLSGYYDSYPDISVCVLFVFEAVFTNPQSLSFIAFCVVTAHFLFRDWSDHWSNVYIVSCTEKGKHKCTKREQRREEEKAMNEIEGLQKQDREKRMKSSSWAYIQT